ncbi:MAG: bile acid:sodium symporter family protein [Geosporobacter ferrireducens]|nr:bile acid:sodium symporter family protein [Geosporobacter ferrireducens]MTI57458.1 bile acid:sodium symporter family protein [Geosporobacter ferrireducens]
MCLQKIARIISKYFGVIIIVFMILGFVTPGAFKWVTSKLFGQPVINILLGIIMFGMGMTLSLNDFKIVLKRPLDVLKGTAAQFIIMPVLALFLSKLFGLEEALMVGVVLVGTCPGGTASNVISYMAGGDVALSVAMTTVSTLLAPILTPTLTYLLIKQTVSFSPVSMFMSIIQVVLLPITVGLIVKAVIKEKADVVESYMPAVSTISIACIVGGVIGANAAKILSSLGLIVLVVILHNACGYALGFLVGKLTGMDRKKSITLAVEVGMQNSGLAASLAASQFAAMPLAAVPAALFSAWHNISGAIFAWVAKSLEKDTSHAQ